MGTDGHIDGGSWGPTIHDHVRMSGTLGTGVDPWAWAGRQSGRKDEVGVMMGDLETGILTRHVDCAGWVVEGSLVLTWAADAHVEECLGRASNYITAQSIMHICRYILKGQDVESSKAGGYVGVGSPCRNMGLRVSLGVRAWTVVETLNIASSKEKRTCRLSMQKNPSSFTSDGHGPSDR